MRKFRLYALMALITVILLPSCSEDATFVGNVDMTELVATLEEEIIPTDSIIEISDEGMKTRTATVRSYSYWDDTGIDGIVGMPVNLVIKQNPFSRSFVTYKGANLEAKLDNESKKDDQKFFLRQMPLTGWYYFVPVQNTSTLLSSGYYTNNPNVPILYSKTSTSSLGAVWSIQKGNSDNTSLVLYNEDLLEQGTGGWFDVYSLAMGVNTSNGNINFSKYTGARTQQFEIRPCDDFRLIDMQLSQYAQSSIVSVPDFVITESYSNNGSVQQGMTTKITQRAQKTSNFSRRTSLSTNVTTSIKVGAFFASGKIDISVGGNQEWSYGTSETKHDEREYNFPLIVPAYSRVDVTITVTRAQANINYRAKLQGINTGYQIWEEGTWTNVDCTTITVHLNEYNLLTGAKTGTRTITGIPTQAVRASN